MTTHACDEMHLLVQADLDGELSAADAARVANHLAGCAACSDAQARIAALSSRLRTGVGRHRAPDRLRAAVAAQVATATRTGPSAAPRTTRRAFASGFGLAACLAGAAWLWPRSPDLQGAVVAAHVRALQPGHLMDVVSTDQHTVKPWFDGRLPFAPPVKDLSPDGFPLAGGRLDYLPGQAAAVMVYRRDRHVVDLFVWPSPDGGSWAGRHDGYETRSWHADGMAFWAVSDVAADDLDEFARAWRAH